jgi:hypothetical protein
VEPIVVTATRTHAFGLSETELLIGSVVVIAVLAWTIIARMRRHHQPHA